MVTTVHEGTELQMSIVWKKFLINLRDKGAEGIPDDTLHEWAKLCSAECLEAASQRHGGRLDLSGRTTDACCNDILNDQFAWVSETVRKLPERCVKTRKFLYSRVVRLWMCTSDQVLNEKLERQLLTIPPDDNTMIAQVIRETFQQQTDNEDFSTILLAKMCAGLIANADQDYIQYSWASVKENNGVLNAMAKAMARYASFDDMIVIAKAVTA